MFFSMELKTFLRLASKRERAEVAVACKGSVAHLYQLAGGHRYASPRMAINIERLSCEVAQRSGGRLQPVPRWSMVQHPEIFTGVLSTAVTSSLGGHHDRD